MVVNGVSEIDPISSRSFAVFSRAESFRLPRETIVALAIFAIVWETAGLDLAALCNPRVGADLYECFEPALRFCSSHACPSSCGIAAIICYWARIRCRDVLFEFVRALQQAVSPTSDGGSGRLLGAVFSTLV